MALQASDLPETIKQQMLINLRHQLGDDKYQNLVAAIGKDGLINLVLNQLSETTYEGYEASSQSPVRPASVVKRPNIFLEAFGITIGLMAMSAGNGFSEMRVWAQIVLYSLYWLAITGPAAFFIILPSAYILAVVYLVIRNLIGDARMAIGGKVVGVTAILGVVGYLLWLVVPWLVTGVRQWWAWLGGHF